MVHTYLFPTRVYVIVRRHRYEVRIRRFGCNSNYKVRNFSHPERPIKSSILVGLRSISFAQACSVVYENDPYLKGTGIV